MDFEKHCDSIESFQEINVSHYLVQTCRNIFAELTVWRLLHPHLFVRDSAKTKPQFPNLQSSVFEASYHPLLESGKKNL